MCSLKRYFSLLRMYRECFPPPELCKQFLAVFIKWGASAMKYIFRYLAYRFIALKQMSILSLCRFLCILQKRRLGEAPSDVTAITHKLNDNSKIVTASQNKAITLPDVTPLVAK